jgi:hypothetical protein
MIAASTSTMPFDIMLVVHIMLAVATLAVLIVLRSGAAAVAKGAPGTEQARRFPVRRNWAARLLHLMPITGMALVGMGGSDVSFSHGWIIAGLLLWLAAAGHLEARVLPSEKVLAATIAHDGSASPQVGKKFGLSIDVVLSLVALALIVMIWQP